MKEPHGRERQRELVVSSLASRESPWRPSHAYDARRRSPRGPTYTRRGPSSPSGSGPWLSSTGLGIRRFCARARSSLLLNRTRLRPDPLRTRRESDSSSGISGGNSACARLGDSSPRSAQFLEPAAFAALSINSERS